MVMVTRGLKRKSDRIKILVADEQPLMRQALRELLKREPDFKIMAEIFDSGDIIRLVNELKPDVIIVDISMFKSNSTEATRLIKEANPDVRVLVFTTETDDQNIFGNLGAGASGYLLKGVLIEEIVRAVRSVVDGGMNISYSVGQRVMQYIARYRKTPTLQRQREKLSTRESEVLQFVAQGMSNKDISLELGITLRTVKGHLSDIFSKLSVNSRTEAVIAGLRSDLVTIDNME